MAVKILGALDVTGDMNITSSDVPNLDASKITSGTLGTARIPSLAASKITSGTLGSARIPTALTQGVTQIGSSTDYIGINKDGSNTISFVIDGVEVARLTASGDLKVKGDVIAVDGDLNQ
jgi:hypothetical protein